MKKKVDIKQIMQIADQVSKTEILDTKTLKLRCNNLIIDTIYQSIEGHQEYEELENHEQVLVISSILNKIKEKIKL